jgi:hypothetical protein
MFSGSLDIIFPPEDASCGSEKRNGPEYFPCWFSGIKNHTKNIVVYESMKGIRKFFFDNFNLQIRRFGRHAEFEGGWSGVLSG